MSDTPLVKLTDPQGCAAENLRDMARSFLEHDPSVGIERDQAQHDLLMNIATALENGELYCAADATPAPGGAQT